MFRTSGAFHFQTCLFPRQFVKFPLKILIWATCYWGLCLFQVVPLFGPMMLPTLQIPEIIHREEDYCLQLNKIKFVKSRRLRETEAGGLCDSVMDGRQLQRGTSPITREPPCLLGGVHMLCWQVCWSLSYFYGCILMS